MRGKIIKGIAGFYYVHVMGEGVFECRAKGIFRNRKVKPLVGDDVRIDVVDGVKTQGNVVEVYQRKNCLERPAVANVDQAMAVFATANPPPNLYLLDVFLVRMEQVGVPALIGMNKVDVDDGANTEWIHEIYKRSGYPILFFSVKEGENMNVLKECLAHKTTVLAGPSGVGKSSLTNYLHPSAGMEVGALSGKGGRGKHTTRHSELFALDGCYVMDTPGFSSLEPPKMAAGELKECIPEFAPYGTNCKYLDCVHVGERDCAVKKAVEEGGIHEARYGNYVKMFETLKQGERFV